MDDTQEQIKEQSNSRPWLYKKGQSGNPGGRPKGSKSLKTYIKEKLATMTDEEREMYLDGLPKQTVWAMAEGNPTSELTGKDGKDLIPEDSARIKALTEQLNATIHGSGSISGDGATPNAVGAEAPNPK